MLLIVEIDEDQIINDFTDKPEKFSGNLEDIVEIFVDNIPGINVQKVLASDSFKEKLPSQIGCQILLDMK